MKVISHTIEEFINNAKNSDYEIINICFDDKSKYKKLIKYCKTNGKNDPSLFVIVANCYISAKGVKANLKKMFKYYRKAALLGDAFGAYYLGECYFTGFYVKKDYEMAFYWFKKGAEQGDKHTQLKLGKCYYYGYGVKQDIEQALDYYKKSADQGYHYAQYFIGKYYDEKGDYKEAINWYKKAAEQGNNIAQLNLGNWYYNGKVVAQDYKEAVYWYLKFVGQGTSIHRVKYILGECYQYGRGVSQDYEEAFIWYMRAARGGYDRAQFSLGYFYETGKGTKQSYESAFEWYRKAAEQGYYLAQNSLGKCYYSGKGVIQDYNEAAKWYKKAAEQGDSDAQFNLGNCYYHGIGVAKDFEMAVKWYKTADLYGHALAKNQVKIVQDLINKQNEKKSKLIFNEHKDAFISWNHYDYEYKNELVQIIEKDNKYYSCWESDTDCHGNLSDAIKNAIMESRSFIVVVTGNSLKSNWVKQEISIALEKAKKIHSFTNCIKPILLNVVNENGQKQFFDVIKELDNLKTKDPNNPFVKLYNNFGCVFPSDNDESINEEVVTNFIDHAVNYSKLIEYRKKTLDKYCEFQATLKNVLISTDTTSGILPTMLKYSEAYIDRPLYDSQNNTYNIEDIKKFDLILIYGEGGSGKSLYVNNFILKVFNDSNLCFMIRAKNIMQEISDNIDFLNIILKEYESYFIDSKTNTFKDVKISNEQFKKLLSSKETYIIVDGLDEVNELIKIKLVQSIALFKINFKSIKFVFTSRKASDYAYIEQILSQRKISLNLRPLELSDCETLYTNIRKVFKNKNNDKRIKNDEDQLVETEFIPNKEQFFISLNAIDDEIKRNPMLLSNLIYIYFITHKIMDKKYDIVDKTVGIVIEDLEREKDINFKYFEYIKNNKLSAMLEYIAFCRSKGSAQDNQQLIARYLKLNRICGQDVDDVAEAIAEHLQNRAIIRRDGLAHEIFADYFAACYYYHKFYEENIDINSFISFKGDEEYNTFIAEAKNEFSISDDPWPSISSNLIIKLDFEIHALDSRKTDINEENKNFRVLDDTLNIVTTYFSDKSKTILYNLSTNQKLYFNNFISNKLKKD